MLKVRSPFDGQPCDIDLRKAVWLNVCNYTEQGLICLAVKLGNDDTIIVPLNSELADNLSRELASAALELAASGKEAKAEVLREDEGKTGVFRPTDKRRN